MQGLHLTADLSACATVPALTDPDALRRLCLAAVAEAGLTAVAELFHRFTVGEGSGGESAGITGGPANDAGITGVVLLAESHLAVHTWPELAAVTLDVYVCNFGADNSARAEALLARLEAAFGAGAVERHRLQRGKPPTRPLPHDRHGN